MSAREPDPAFTLKDRLKWWVYPGINLHARHRYRLVPTHLGRCEEGRGRIVLDAGCGNGMLTWQAWRRGNRAVGVTIKEKEAASARRLFQGHLGIPASELDIRVMDLRDPARILEEFGSFDEIICADMIEHVSDDAGMCRSFHRLLGPGGTLHLTTPNSEHPYNATFPLDREEGGGHVRPGYASRDFHSLLEPLGFRVEVVRGFGGPIRQGFNRRIKEVQQRFGPYAGVPLFLAAMTLLWLDPADPAVPFSWYARARKSGGAGTVGSGEGA